MPEDLQTEALQPKTFASKFAVDVFVELCEGVGKLHVHIVDMTPNKGGARGFVMAITNDLTPTAEEKDEASVNLGKAIIDRAFDSPNYRNITTEVTLNGGIKRKILPDGSLVKNYL